MTNYTYTFLIMRIFLWCCIVLDSVLFLVTLRAILFTAAGKDLNNSVTLAIERPVEILEKVQRLTGYAYLVLIILTFYGLMKLLTWHLVSKNITPRFTPLLSGFSWVIPILNIFRPPQVIAYLRDNLPLSPEEGRKTLLYPNRLFWALWWISLASRICLIFLSRTDTSSMSPERWLDLAILQSICDAYNIFWLFLLARIIGVFATKLSIDDTANSA